MKSMVTQFCGGEWWVYPLDREERWPDQLPRPIQAL